MLYEYAASNQSGTKTLYMVEGRKRSDGMSTISTKDEVHSNIKKQGLVSNLVQVQTMTLDEIFTQAHINCDIDFISIDVEGHEYEVLEGFSIEKWKPCIILIEDNFYSENPIHEYLEKYGYVRFMRTGVNDWYAHQNNSQLVNSRNIKRAKRVSLIMKIKNKFFRMIFLTEFRVFTMKVKNRFRKVPILVKLKKFLTIKGSRP